MKLDQETIIKHHFWGLAAFAALLALVAWVLLLLSAPGTVANERKKIQDKWDQNKRHSKFIHQESIDALDKEAELLKSQRSSMQGQLYQEQLKATSLMTWPPKMEDASYSLRYGRYAMDFEIQKDKLPPDDATHVSGVLIASEVDWFKIKDRNEKIVTLLKTDKPAKEIPWDRMAGLLQSQVTVTFTEGKFFGEDLTSGEKAAYADAYQEQLLSVLAELKPVNLLGQPIVLFRYPKKPPENYKPDPKTGPEYANDVWIYSPKKLPPHDPQHNRFFTYVPTWPNRPGDIDSAEIWTAQEAVWIQREIFKQLRLANESLAEFKKVKTSEDGKTATYEGHYWSVDLKLTDRSIEVQLTNRLTKPQGTDGVRFVARMKGAEEQEEPIIFPPRGTGFGAYSVGPRGSGNEKFPAARPAVIAKDPKLTSLDQIESLQQLLTVETAAVKRLDVLAPGSSVIGDMTISHAIAWKTPQSYKAKIAATIKPVDPDNPGAGGGAPKPDFTIRRTPNGLVLEIYTEKTTEFRKVPVLLVMAVSPEHANLVQAQLVSSPLRFFPMQVLFHRCPVMLNAVPPATPDLAIAGGGDNYAECVELTIYGVITIYERPGSPPP